VTVVEPEQRGGADDAIVRRGRDSPLEQLSAVKASLNASDVRGRVGETRHQNTIAVPHHLLVGEDLKQIFVVREG
jgi:hypothetical protein